MTKTPRDPTYRLYIDESGDHSYKKLDRPGHVYLSLHGVWFKRKVDYEEFSDRLTRFKRDQLGVSPDDQLVLHRKEIISKVGPYSILQDSSKRALFNRALFDLIENAKFTMTCAIVNKKRLAEQYPEPFHPYHYALEALVERYCYWLAERTATGDVIAEARGKAEDRKLQAIYKGIATSGTRYMKGELTRRVLTSHNLKLYSKQKDSPGLQLADLLAHPVKRYWLSDEGHQHMPSCFSRDLAELVLKKHRCGHNGTIKGYGCVWL